jgi:DNA-binding CsgD family transcriptional regulator
MNNGIWSSCGRHYDSVRIDAWPFVGRVEVHAVKYVLMFCSDGEDTARFARMSDEDRAAQYARVSLGRRSRVPLDDLTEREREVLALMAEGRSNQAIGDRLSMARKTVEAHIANIFSKLELPPAADDHRRVLAVLAHLRGSGTEPSPSG